MRKVSQLMFFSFVGVQLLGLFVGWNFIQMVQQGLIPPLQGFEDPSDVFNALKLFAFIIFSVLVLFAVLYLYKGKDLFFILELLIIFASINMFLLIILPPWTPEIAVYVLALFFVLLRWKIPGTKTAFLLFSSAVIGPFIGTSFDLSSPDFPVGPAVLVVLIFAFYDIVAVFGTKHMVKLAKELDKRQAAFAVSFSHKKETVQLGTGDMVLPSILITSALKLSLMHSLFALAGAAFGLVFLIYLLERKKGYYPALPPIVFWSLVFLGAYHFMSPLVGL